MAPPLSTLSYAALGQEVEAELVRTRGAVRRGRHFRFQCPVHEDRHPSADFEPNLQVWVCRTCHVGGGVRDLARRLGLEASAPSRPRPLQPVPPPPRGMSMEDWAPAWLAIVETARRQEARLMPYRELGRVADWLRSRYQAVADAHYVISALGEEDSGAWRLAGLAARVSTAAWAVEDELDGVFRHGA